MKLQRPGRREPRIRAKEALAVENTEGIDFDATTEVPMSLWQEVDEVLAGGGENVFSNVVQLILLDPERKEKLRASQTLRKKVREAFYRKVHSCPVYQQELAWAAFFPHAQVFPELIQEMRQISHGKFDRQFFLIKKNIVFNVADIDKLIAFRLMYPDHTQEICEWFEEIQLFAWLNRRIAQAIQNEKWGEVIHYSAKTILLFPEQQEEIKNLIKPIWGNLLSCLRAGVKHYSSMVNIAGPKQDPGLSMAEYYYNLSLLAAGEVDWGADGIIRTHATKVDMNKSYPLPDRTHF